MRAVRTCSRTKPAQVCKKVLYWRHQKAVEWRFAAQVSNEKTHLRQTTREGDIRLFQRPTFEVEDFGSDLGLAGFVVFEGELLQEVFAVVGGRLHRNGPRGMFGGGLGLTDHIGIESPAERGIGGEADQGYPGVRNFAGSPMTSGFLQLEETRCPAIHYHYFIVCLTKI